MSIPIRRTWPATRRARTALRLLLAALASGALLVSGAPAAHAGTFRHNPILFVHGIEGSGAQFESQAMRFETQDYPRSYIDEVDYNSTAAVGNTTEVDKQIDEAIAALKKATGHSQVDVIAHSLGTTVMYGYLTEGEKAAERKANVGHYINVDGQEKNPGVPTLAVWGGRGLHPGAKMLGAQNVTIPNQTHVQTMTSAESFIQYFTYLWGRPPAHDIDRQNNIQIAGKALDFPQNTGLIGTTVQVWPVGSSGQRSTATPLASIEITDGSEGGGRWGPVTVLPRQRYEFALVTPGQPTLHVYPEPFVRSDYAVRLLASPAIEAYTGNRAGSVGSVMVRYKEFWGDQTGENDQLLINGLNVCTAHLCPISKNVNAFFAFDRENKKETNLSEPDPVLSQLPFIQGADVYIPASPTHNGTVSFQLVSRSGGGLRTLNVPNWESTTDGVSIQWRDFEKLTF